MSGGGIVLAPALLLAPVAVAVAGAAAAAALVIRTAQAGTEATGRALAELAAELEREASAQDERERCARQWDLAACAVVATSQELRLLAARAAKAGIRAPLPGPLDLTGHTAAQARDWVVATQPVLASARAVIEAAETDQEQRELVSRLPVPAGEGFSVDDLYARLAATLANRGRPDRPVPAVDKGLVQAEIDEIVARLHRDATAAEREQVIKLAARAASQRDPGMSRTFLDALARTVDREINPKATDRRRAAGWLNALEHPMVAKAIVEAAEPRPPHLGAVDRLRAVVAGDTDLTDDDRRDAAAALDWARKQADRRGLLAVVAETFAGLGYSVTTGMQVHHTTALHATRGRWDDEHRADIWIDEALGVQGRLVELTPGARAAASRCEDFNQSLRAVGEALVRRGYAATVKVPRQLMPPTVAHDGRRRPQATNAHGEETAPRARQIDRTEGG